MGVYGGTIDYRGVLPRHVGLNCVDYFHHVMFGEVWNAKISNLGIGDVSLHP